MEVRVVPSLSSREDGPVTSSMAPTETGRTRRARVRPREVEKGDKGQRRTDSARLEQRDKMVADRRNRRGYVGKRVKSPLWSDVEGRLDAINPNAI
jgi:hypothetical protein